MNRKDIEIFGKIQTRLHGYCGKVLALQVNDYPEEEPWFAEDTLEVIKNLKIKQKTY